MAELKKSKVPKPKVEISPEEIHEILEKVSFEKVQTVPQLHINSEAILVLIHQTLSTSKYLDQDKLGRIKYLELVFPSCTLTHGWINQIGNLISSREEILEEIESQVASVFKAQKE